MSSSSVSKGEFPTDWTKWVTGTAVPQLVAPVAIWGSTAIVIKGFIDKTARQLEQQPTKMPIREIAKIGIKGGFFVGFQVYGQSRIEKMIKQKMGEDAGYKAMLASTALVSIFSVAPLAIFGGYSNGLTAWQSLTRLTPRQVRALVLRENSFLISMEISGPITKKMKGIFGDNWFVTFASAAVSGAAGSICGHAPDTVFTRLQKRKDVNWRHWKLGFAERTKSLVALSVIYTFTKEAINSRIRQN